MIFTSIPLTTILFFIFGLTIGSFLNVVVYRMNTYRSFGGRSACMSCKHQLSWWELIPVFSFIFLLGRCKNCKTKISFQYPIVELVTGFIFAALFLKLQNIFPSSYSFFFAFAYYAVAFCILVLIATYDVKHKIIPDILVFTFSILVFIGLFFFDTSGVSLSYSSRLSFHVPSLLEFLSGIFIALPFVSLWLVSRGAWIGLGDAKLALGMGWFLGLGTALSGVALAFWIGAFVGICLILFSKVFRFERGYGMKSEIPFALYLVLGAFLAFIFDLHFFGF